MLATRRSAQKARWQPFLLYDAVYVYVIKRGIKICILYALRRLLDDIIIFFDSACCDTSCCLYQMPHYFHDAVTRHDIIIFAITLR